MLRNREIQYLLLTLSIIAVLGTIGAGILFNFPTALFVLAISILLIVCMFIFTKHRYLEIEKLSGYLQEISNGNYRLDVRDNYEGELSILKSNIYKVTKMLSEKSVVLNEDKEKLNIAISDISHQLKTPLTSLMIMADLLEDEQLDESRRNEFTRNIQIQLERMEWLVSSLLKLSKIDAGTIVFKQEEVNLPKLIQTALEPLLVPLEIKQQNYQITGNENTTFIGDFNWTTEALINIIKNCMEHTLENGSLAIHFEENALFTEIRITDNGKGIPKEELPHLFKRFYKGRNASDDSVGIGLAMAYSIITSQQGDIEVRSEVGTGTTFHIKFYKQVI